MLLRISDFKGIAPSVAADMLPDGMAVSAVNVDLRFGKLQPIKQSVSHYTGPLVASSTAIFKYYDKWLSATALVASPVLGAIPNDPHKRVYWTVSSGDATHTGYGDYDTVAAGTGPWPAASLTLGVPAPDGVLSAVVEGEIPVSVDVTEVVSFAFIYTYVTEFGEEGPPTSPTDIIDLYPGQTLRISVSDTVPNANRRITTRRFYVTNTGSSTTEYQWIADAPIALTEVSGYDPVAALEFAGEVITSTFYDPPPSGLSGLTAMPFGSMAGYIGNVLYLSEPYLPHAWPAANAYAFADTIMGIGVFGSSLLVTTTGAPYILTGQSPGGMSSDRLEAGYACVNSRCVVDMGHAVLYPSTEGLISVSQSGVVNLTAQLSDKKEFASLVSGIRFACQYGGAYLAIGTTSLAFDTLTNTFTTLSGGIAAALGAYTDPDTGYLYWTDGSVIYQYEASSSYHQATWKSKEYALPLPVNMAVIQIRADVYPVKYKVYADGVLKHTSTVTNKEPARLPAGFVSDRWQVELYECTSVITSVMMATSMTELSQT